MFNIYVILSLMIVLGNLCGRIGESQLESPLYEWSMSFKNLFKKGWGLEFSNKKGVVGKKGGITN